MHAHMFEIQDQNKWSCYIKWAKRYEPTSVLTWGCIPTSGEENILSCAVLSCSDMSESFTTPWTVAHKASLSMGLSRQEYWSGLPFPSSEDLPYPGIKPPSSVSPVLQANSTPNTKIWTLIREGKMQKSKRYVRCYPCTHPEAMIWYEAGLYLMLGQWNWPIGDSGMLTTLFLWAKILMDCKWIS